MEVYINEKKVDFARRKRVTVNDLLNQLEVGQPNEDISIRINGEEVSKAEWLKQGISEEDRVDIKVRD